MDVKLEFTNEVLSNTYTTDLLPDMALCPGILARNDRVLSPLRVAVDAPNAAP